MMPRIGKKGIKQIETSEPSDTTPHWRCLPELPVTSTAPPMLVKEDQTIPVNLTRCWHLSEATLISLNSMGHYILYLVL